MQLTRQLISRSAVCVRGGLGLIEEMWRGATGTRHLRLFPEADASRAGRASLLKVAVWVAPLLGSTTSR